MLFKKIIQDFPSLFSLADFAAPRYQTDGQMDEWSHCSNKNS